MSFCSGNFTVIEAVYVEAPSLALTLIVVDAVIVKSGSLSPKVFGDISVESNGPKHR